MKGTLTNIVKGALKLLAAEGKITLTPPTPFIEMTRDRRFGDYATNVAMIMASRMEGVGARDLAEEVAARIWEMDGGRNLDEVKVAGPGFINLTMSPAFWIGTLRSVLREGGDFARTDVGKGRRVQVEFVSANPTGPLHVGHGRGAALGDALANVLSYAGYEVQREYYINDAGNQIQTLGLSVYARYLQACRRDVPFPEEGYKGDYIRQIAGQLIEEQGDRYLEMPEEQAVEEIAVVAAGAILEDIRQDLEEFGVRFDRWFSEKRLLEEGAVEEFGVRFDRWFSEKRLLEEGAVQATLAELEKSGHTYSHEGALWFRSTDMGDDKDRVMVKGDGSLTYFASDVAYHREKYQRGFHRVVDIWGADHHGYVARMKAAVQALGRQWDDLQVLLIQLVSLSRKGVPVAMSTRAGEFVTLRQVREEVGRDAARFIFLTRKADSKLDFDLDLAKEQSNDNPVYYVQYAHARICSILRNAGERGVDLPDPEDVDLMLLQLPEERELIRYMAALPDVVEGAAVSLEPHRLTTYLRDISTILHNYYYHHRVLADDVQLTASRLALMLGVKTAIGKALELLGVSAPERM